ncbi:MAG: thiol:disulfide interchange protein [Lutibacter sp.]|nr:MAG: thiol:disulfide interchange protein [Lutibacter sp.]
MTILFSCSNKKKGDMTVQGTITRLQKGTLYLQKMQDTLLVSVDSITLKGSSTFMLSDHDTEPQLYYLTLKEKSDEKIDFFGEKGIITINTKLEKFYSSAKIEGSKSHKLLEKYREMMSKFSGKRLDLIKEIFEAQTAKDDVLIVKLDKDLQRLIKKRYLYTTNFSVKNGKSEVAPYLALTELYDAHISLLDTVNNSLSKKVKASLYGKKLDAFVRDIKANEK